MMKVAIADDEVAARSRLRRLLKNEGELEVVGEYPDGDAALVGVRETRPDVLLLDIEMPGTDGLAVARELVDARDPIIVFVTAFDQYALRAFEVHAFDYLVKPIDAKRLHETFERIAAQRHRHDPADLATLIAELRAHRDGLERVAPRHYRERLLVSNNGRTTVVQVGDIDWIEAAGNYVRLHRGTTSVLLRESLAALEEALDPASFARIHRGVIVNLNRVKELQPWFSGSAVLILNSGQKLRLSRSYRRPFMVMFSGHDDEQ